MFPNMEFILLFLVIFLSYGQLYPRYHQDETKEKLLNDESKTVLAYSADDVVCHGRDHVWRVVRVQAGIQCPMAARVAQWL